MITMENLATDRPSPKLAERHISPYQIEKILSPNIILVKLPANIKISPQINVSCLRPYIEPSISGQKSHPQPPISVDNDGVP
jgi:hypothetical protein